MVVFDEAGRDVGATEDRVCLSKPKLGGSLDKNPEAGLTGVPHAERCSWAEMYNTMTGSGPGHNKTGL